MNSPPPKKYNRPPKGAMPMPFRIEGDVPLMDSVRSNQAMVVVSRTNTSFPLTADPIARKSTHTRPHHKHVHMYSCSKHDKHDRICIPYLLSATT